LQRQLAPHFKDEAEYQHFLETLRTHLPISFRINPTNPNYKLFLSKLLDPEYMKSKFFKVDLTKKPDSNSTPSKNNQDSSEQQQSEYTDKVLTNVDTELDPNELWKAVNLRPVQWNSHNFIWTMNMSRNYLKRSEGLSRLHKWIQRAGDCGLLTR
jgi:16S rRNA C967 or C1407 C5-methylase (RsmB/RsmF family)